jgi:biotin carboxyl carrier protein
MADVTARVGGRAFRVAAGGRGAVRTVVLEETGRVAEVSGSGAIRRISIDGRTFEACVVPAGRPSGADRGDVRYDVTIAGRLYAVSLVDSLRSTGDGARAAGTDGPSEIRAVMPGKVVEVLVGAGATVAAGQGLVVVEAMKMENEITAPRPGTVSQVKVRSGEAVEAGALLVVLD